jgi:hypothetical protein
MKSMNPPTTVNQIYRLAGVWVKPTARAETGTGATYHMEQKKMQQKEECKTEESRNPRRTCLRSSATDVARKAT